MSNIFRNKYYSVSRRKNCFIFRNNQGEKVFTIIPPKTVVRLTNNSKAVKTVDTSYELGSDVLNISYQAPDFRYACKLSLDSTSNIKLEAEFQNTSDDKDIILEEAAIRFRFPHTVKRKLIFSPDRSIKKACYPFSYWLENQGMSVKGRRAFHVYHIPGISSAKYKSSSRTTEFYLDHKDDHPYYGIDLNGKKWDRSSTVVPKGGVISGKFSFQVGEEVNVNPLLMMHPDGFESTLIFTQHPDNSRIETVKAVLLGSSELNAEDEPKGGFLKHQIPYTQGVFYTTAYPQHISLFDHQNSEDYRILIDRLYNETSSEICLHTMDSHNFLFDKTREALKYVRESYGSRNWIDHSPKIKKECISALATDKDSDYYIQDLLEEEKVSLCWHYGSEAHYGGEHNILYDAKGINTLRVPGFLSRSRHNKVFRNHNSRLGVLINWKTTAIGRQRHFPTKGEHWLAFFMQELKKLIGQKGLSIIHDYHTWHYEKRNADGNGIYKRVKDENGEKFIIDPHFDLLLRNISAMRDKGVLNITTIDKFEAHQQALKNILIHYPGKDQIVLENKSETLINGLSIFIEKGAIINSMDKAFRVKEVKDGSLCIFDLGGGEKVTLEFKPS